MIYLDDNALISSFENNLVNLTLPSGETFTALEPRRLFPVSRKNEYITFLDKEEKEVARIRNIDDINKESKSVLLFALDMYYFVPEILSVNSVEKQNSGIRFYVTTNLGETNFLVVNQIKNIRKMADGSIRFRDRNDNRYIISNPEKLDRKSKARLFVYL